MKKQLLSILTCLCLALTLLPATALAEGVACGQGDSCTEHAAAIGGFHYGTLAEAFANATDDAEIVLLRDETVSATITSTEDVTLDLNGHTVTGSDGKYGCRVFHVTAGTLTLDGAGTVTTEGENNENPFDPENSVIRVGKDTQSAGLVVGKDVRVIAPMSYGVTIFGNDGIYTLDVYGTIEVTRNDNSGTNRDESAIGSNGSSTGTTKITIYDGAVVRSTDNFAIYHPQDQGTLTIKGGTITGVGGGIQMCSGTLIVEDGTISGTGRYDSITTYDGGGDGALLDGAAISLVQRPGYDAAPSATINGGRFSAADPDGAVQHYKWVNNQQVTWDAGTAPASIYGGYFTSNPKDYVKSGMTAQEGSYSFDGVTYSYTVGVDSNATENIKVETTVAIGTSNYSPVRSDIEQLAGYKAFGKHATQEAIEGAFATANHAHLRTVDWGSLAANSDIVGTKEEMIQALIAAGTDMADVNKVQVRVKPYVQMNQYAYDESRQILSLDVEVLCDTEVSIPGGNRVPFRSGVPVHNDTLPIPISIPVVLAMSEAAEANNNTAYITHFKDDGSVYLYEGTIGPDSSYSSVQMLTFKTTHGFSPMMVTLAPPAAVIAKKAATYETLQEAIDAADGTAGNPTVIQLMSDVTENVTVPVGKNIVIDGGADKHTIYGQVKCSTSQNAEDVTSLTLQNLTLDGKDLTSGYGIYSADQNAQAVNSLNLTLENCTVQNFNKKGIYLTNAKTLKIDACTFQNNAGEDMNHPNTYGDYTIDLNLVAVQGADISITNTTFSGTCGKKAVVKVVQRGAGDGTGATDITGAMASIQNFVLSGCTFTNSTAAADVNLGTAKKDLNTTDDNLTGNFPATISNNQTPVVVRMPYLNTTDSDSDNTSESTPSLTVPAGKTAYKPAGADSVLTVQTEPVIPETPSTPDTSHSNDDDDDDGYSVSVPASSSIWGGSITVSPRSADKGDTVTITVKPDDGYVLGTLTVTTRAGAEVDLTQKNSTQYTFTMPAGAVGIDVSFVPEDQAAEMAFADVAESYWAHDEIAWAWESGYMTGTSATAFNPGGTVSRQQVWMILARMAGASPADMAAARAWAVANGISDGTNPGGPVTRQQLAALLYRYAVQNGMAAVTMKENLSGYPDAAAVAEYAVQALNWAVGQGIIGGTTQGTLNPGGTATRAQLAVMLYRWLAA